MTELGKLFQIFKKMKRSQYWRAVKFSEFKDIISGNEGKKFESSNNACPVCFTHRSFTILIAVSPYRSHVSDDNGQGQKSFAYKRSVKWVSISMISP